ncbi:MAG: sel1 repeat family protein [Akkermansia sp.]|nr:sel1 repeat family protein [Akkermansia sp.]
MEKPIHTLLAAIGSMLTAMGAEPAVPPTWAQVETDYTTTAYILNDPGNESVQNAISTLERCTAQGHPLAAILLLDVYEGKRRALTAQPEKAALLALNIATGELQLSPEHHQSTQARLESMYRYALYCEKGIGRKKSNKDAYEWMLKASNGGYGKARVELARYLIIGKGGHKNPRIALKLLKAQAATDASVPNLFFYLGYIYQNARPKPNHKMAFRFYTYGEHFNDARAINNLASMYEKGIGTDKDEHKALRLYKKAAQLGNKDASANMQRLAYIQAERGSDTPYGVRVDNAAMQVIESLPLPAHMRSALSAPFKQHAEQNTHKL